MNRIVGACLSQFHGDEDNYEFLVAYSDGREIGNVVSKDVASTIAKDMAHQLGFNETNGGLHDAAQDMLEALKGAIEYGMVPTSSALEGGANAHSMQLRVADKIRAAIAKAEGRS